MIIVRKSQERGLTHTDWLKSLHTFSFGDYYNPAFTQFGRLRVINEDTVQPGGGFGTHPHRDMEIISYVVEGAIEHKDSMGNGSVIKPGEIQRMSAGTGVTHSEFNHSSTQLLHFLQVWIIPYKTGLKPGYEQITIQKRNDQLILVGSSDGREGSITIQQSVDLYAAYLKAGIVIEHRFKQPLGWLQLIKGQIKLQEQLLSAGDGAAVSEENAVQIQCVQDAEFLLFDLA